MRLSRRAALLLAGLGFATKAVAAPARRCCPIVELRQYTLKPGRRDELVELFEQNFIESQEALGMSLIGQFRDLDKPDRFVWLRGFSDMASRAPALQTFYTSPLWKAHSKAANDTMIDTDNVLLLHPARAASSFELPEVRAPFAKGHGEGLVTATIYALAAPAGDAFIDFFEREVAARVSAAGATIRASFVSEHSPNNFPALPVREGENVFVWFASFASEAAYQKYLQALAASAPWQVIAARLRAQLKDEPQVLRLAPTVRSLLHG